MRESTFWFFRTLTLREIFNCFGFALLRRVFGAEISLHFLNQSDSKLEPIASYSQPRFPALQPVCATLSLIDCS